MIRDGEALLVSDVPDLLDMLDLAHGGAGTTAARGGRTASPTRSRDLLPPRERTILDALPARGVRGLGELVRAAGLSQTDVLAGIGDPRGCRLGGGRQRRLATGAPQLDPMSSRAPDSRSAPVLRR